MNNKLASDIHSLVMMLSAIEKQIEAANDKGFAVNYVTETYPAMIEQIGKVLVGLGQVNLVS